jgi:hypothetical protein
MASCHVPVKQITLTVQATDDLSGFKQVEALFKRFSASGQRLEPGFYLFAYISAGGDIYYGANALPQYSAYGRWYLYQIESYDQTGNWCFWYDGQSSPQDPACTPQELIYFVNGADNGPPPTATSTPTDTPL